MSDVPRSAADAGSPTSPASPATELSSAQRTLALGRAALTLLILSVLLQVVVGRLGPSVAVPPISPDLDSSRLANAWLVTLLLAAALTAGGFGIALGLHALRHGWRPSATRLLAGAALGVVVLLVGPPLGTADLGGYAAYGRMSVVDRDPYATTPRDLAGDPVADAAEAPWRDIPSIYGPLATAEFHLAASLGGHSREAVLRLLSGASGLAFVATGLLLDRRASRFGPEARRRAALLWSANPLLLHQLVAGGHLDSLLALLVTGGVLAADADRTRLSGTRLSGTRLSGTRLGNSVLSGGLLGLAGLVKATAAAPAAGLAIAQALTGDDRAGDRRTAGLRRVAAFGAAGVVVAALGYAAVGGLSALTPTRDASRFVSRGTPWRFVASGLEQVLPHDLARTVVGVLAAALAFLVARRIAAALPQDAPAGLRLALAASVAWLVLAPYALPWYDAIAWALLALLVARSAAVRRLELLLLVHTAFLSVAYLPGRVVGLTAGIATAQDVVRGILAPIVVLGVAVGLTWLPRTSGTGSVAGPEAGASAVRA
jgi:hypothetical protein